MNTLSYKYVFYGAIALALLTWASLFVVNRVYGKITTEQPAMSSVYRSYDFFASTTAQTNFATTTTATSTSITSWTDSSGRIVTGAFEISGAKHVNFYFSRDAGTGGNAGSTNFKVQVTRDGSTWLDYQRLRQATTTVDANAANVLVSSATISAATSTLIYSMDTLGFKAARCIAVVTTDGSNKCAASADF